MKKVVLSIALLIFILVSGCSNTSGTIDKPSYTPNEPTATDNPPEINFEYNPATTYIYVIAVPNLTPDDSFISEWQDYIKDKYDLSIKLIYINEVHPINTQADAGVDINELKKYSGVGGFVYSSHTYNLDSLFASNLIIPVNQFKEDVPALAVLDDQLFANFSYDNQTIWAIPMLHQNEIVIRAYNGDWLAKWECGIPKTLDEFVEYARYIRDSDPDGNGEKDTYIQFYNIRMIYSDFLDIFRAFGCYPLQTSAPIDYNPLTGKFEVAVLSEGYEQAVNYIKFLANENLIVFTDLYGDAIANADFKIASSFAYQFDVMKDCSTLIPAYYLTGENDSSLVKLTTYPWSLSVMKDTENATEKLSMLMDAFNSSPDCSADFECGIKGISYKESETYYHYTLNTVEATGKRPYIGIRNQIGAAVENNKPLLYDSYVYNADRMMMINSFKNKLNSDLTAFEDTQLTYHIGLMKYGNTVDSLNYKIAALTQELNNDLIIDNKPFKSSIDEYKKALENMGIQEELDNLNSLFNN